MDDTRCREFFLAPKETYQRHYEALRAFFIEGKPLNEIAQQFGYQESSLNVMISNFRNQVNDFDNPEWPTSIISFGPPVLINI